jgi:3-deoxy-D-manno-octulosonic-acid transferase
MQRIIYSVIFTLALPIILIRLLIRSVKAPDYRRRIGERLALKSPSCDFDSSKLTLWIHAVSVGETVAAAPLIFALTRNHPELQIVVTTMTPTGSDRVRALFGDKVFHSYIPYDLPGTTNRFLQNYKPVLLILMETELWPNLIHSCNNKAVKIVLANARLSEKSARGYSRFSSFTKSVLQKIDVIAAQAKADADRFVKLGAASANVKVTGSLKFNLNIEPREKNQALFFSGLVSLDRSIVMAASTREGEEEKVLSAFAQCLKTEPSLLLVLVPRHPERFASVTRLCEERGFRFSRRSEDRQVDPDVQVVIGDSMGEMQDYYGAADIAFVGGSLVNTGCQNVLEPAAMAIPVIVGPSQYNFATICKQLEQAGGLKTVQDEAQLAELILQLLADRMALQKMGAQGKALVAANQNALPALLKIVEPLIQTDA